MPSKHEDRSREPRRTSSASALLAHTVARHGIDRRFDERGLGTLAPCGGEARERPRRESSLPVSLATPLASRQSLSARPAGAHLLRQDRRGDPGEAVDRRSAISVCSSRRLEPLLIELFPAEQARIVRLLLDGWTSAPPAPTCVCGRKGWPALSVISARLDATPCGTPHERRHQHHRPHPAGDPQAWRAEAGGHA
jgi:hypothetical protein